jgi:hypothetical protein
MGTCTSTARRRQKQQQHNRTASRNSIVFDIKPPPPLPPLPLAVFPNRHRQHTHSLFTDFDVLSLSLTKPIFHQTDTNSLIQLYSSNTNNNNNNNNNYNITGWMSSSTSVPHAPPRIPVPKTRLPIYFPPQPQQSTPVVYIRPTNVTSVVIPNNQTGNTKVRNYHLVYFHWIIIFFSPVRICYHNHSHLVRIIRGIHVMSHISHMLLYYSSSSFLSRFLLFSVSVDLFIVFDGDCMAAGHEHER